MTDQVRGHDTPGGQRAEVVRAGDAKTLLAGPLGADLLAGADRTGGTVSLLIHPIAPRALGAPVHTHRHEDEWSFVLDGQVGVELDGTTLVAGPGDAILKPRGIPHAFWNAADEPARLLEVVTPAGFEDYFGRLGDLFRSGGQADPERLGAIAAEYGLEIDPASIPRLAEQHGLRLG